MDRPAGEPSIARRLWTRVSDLGNAMLLWQLVGGFGASSYVVSVLPGGWHGPQYWVLAGLAFSIGALAVLLLRQAASAVAARIWKASVVLEPHGGTIATLTVRATGSRAAQVRATGQLVDHDGVRTGAVYDLMFYYMKRERLIATADFAEIEIAKTDYLGNDRFVQLVGSRHRFELRREGGTYNDRYWSSASANILVSLYLDGVEAIARTYDVKWDGRMGKFDIRYEE